MTTGTVCRAKCKISASFNDCTVGGSMYIRVSGFEFPVLKTKNKDHKNDKQAGNNDTCPFQDFCKSSHDGWFWSAEYSHFLKFLSRSRLARQPDTDDLIKNSSGNDMARC